MWHLKFPHWWSLPVDVGLYAVAIENAQPIEGGRDVQFTALVVVEHLKNFVCTTPNNIEFSLVSISSYYICPNIQHPIREPISDNVCLCCTAHCPCQGVGNGWDIKNTLLVDDGPQKALHCPIWLKATTNFDFFCPLQILTQFLQAILVCLFYPSQPTESTLVGVSLSGTKGWSPAPAPRSPRSLVVSVRGIRTFPGYIVVIITLLCSSRVVVVCSHPLEIYVLTTGRLAAD